MHLHAHAASSHTCTSRTEVVIKRKTHAIENTFILKQFERQLQDIKLGLKEPFILIFMNMHVMQNTLLCMNVPPNTGKEKASMLTNKHGI